MKLYEFTEVNLMKHAQFILPGLIILHVDPIYVLVIVLRNQPSLPLCLVNNSNFAH
jgi:hypothetical protein